MTNAVDELFSTLDLDLQGYLLSECREKLNDNLSKLGVEIIVTNRRLKSLLIDKYGDTVCFTYSRKKQDCQMFFSSNIKTTYMAEQLRGVQVIAEYGKILRGMFQKFDFG